MDQLDCPIKDYDTAGGHEVILTGRVRRLEREMAPPDPAAIAFTEEDHARLGLLFELAETTNGPPPCDPDGSLTSDMDALGAWVDEVPDDWEERLYDDLD